MVRFRSNSRGDRPTVTLSPWQPAAGTVGKVFGGRYRIGEALGEDALGVTHRADDVEGGGAVAVHFLRPEASARQALVDHLYGRIRRDEGLERGAPGALGGLVRVREIGRTADGLVFLVMARAGGEDLGTLVAREGPVPWARAAALIHAIARALAPAHALGVAVGELQARRCYLVEGAGAQIVTTGIDAYLMDEGDPLAEVIAPAMARYASPERASGDPCEAAADVYSLGVIFHELLTGRPPFEDSNPSRLLAMHMLVEAPALPAELGVPAAVEAALRRALAKDPDERFADAGALAAALVQAAGLAPVDAAASASALVIPKLLQGPGRSDLRPVVTAPSAAANAEIAAPASSPAETLPSAGAATTTSAAPSASGSLRAGASGSRRAILELREVHSPGESGRGRSPGESGRGRAGESTGRGRILTLESTSHGRVPRIQEGGGSTSTSRGEAPRSGPGEATMRRAVSAALAGAEISASSRTLSGEVMLEQTADGDVPASASLLDLRRDSLAATLEAGAGGDDTITGSGIHGGRRRAAGWVAGGIGVMLLGSVGVALFAPARSADEVAPRAAAASTSILAAPTSAPVVPVPPTLSPEPARVESVEEEAAAEAAAAREPAPSAAAPEPAAKKAAAIDPEAASKRKARRKRVDEPEAPAEDDFLEQVAASLRADRDAKAARAAKKAPDAPAEPLPQPASDAPPPPENTARALDLLEQARRALAKGELMAAYALASQSNGLRRSADALEVMGLSACGQGDAEKARWIHRQLAASRRADVQARCRQAGIELEG